MDERNGCLILEPRGDTPVPTAARPDWSTIGACVRALALKAVADQFLLRALGESQDREGQENPT